MPGSRCIFDGVLLPNGHIVLMGGQKVGDVAVMRNNQKTQAACPGYF